MINIRGIRAFSLLKNDSGVSAIEFAIVAPVFFLMIFGMLTYAIYFGAVHSVQQLAADSARASVAGISPSERSTLAQTSVRNEIGNYPLLDPARLTVNASPAPSDPNLFQIQLSYDASRNAIFALDGLVPMPPRTIERQAVIRRGGY